ncbi:MAG: ABC transporter ATP-binding protein [Planctomycetes bacterium]|nr:ABC transporter ATP-binding protein [Planctomycetota bacterium]
MKNFGHVIRLALRYKLTVIVSMVAALAVAALWGANIGTAYPFVEVAFKGQSLQTWVQTEIDEAEAAITKETEVLGDLNGRLETASEQEQSEIRAQISLVESRIEAERGAADARRRLQPYINRYLPDNPFQTLALVVGFLLVGTIVKDLAIICHAILVARLGELAAFDLRKLFYRRTLRMDLQSFGDDGTSDLMSRFTNDMNCISDGLNALFGKLVREPLKMAACLIGAGWICWRLLLLSLVAAPLAGLLVNWLAKSLKRANRRAMEEMALIYNTLEETFRGIKIVKAFTMERHERNRFHNTSKQYYRKAMRIAGYNSLSHPLTEVMGIITISLALLAGAYLVINGETHLLGVRMTPRPLSLGALLVFYALLAGAADPARKLSDVFTRLQRGAAAADRIYDRLNREPAVRDPRQALPLPRHRQDLVLDNVDFNYRADSPVLKQVSLRIAFGETIAIVGPNGCGKSSLLSLIPRFADPTGGTIRLDGVALTDCRIRDLRRQIGLVTQETLLFDDTVLNNIRYGSPNATLAQVHQAARQAGAHVFIQRDLPDGYETVVGSQGGRLSGGQRQRIALARAILRDPAILLLDEVTSQIDPESEQSIQRALEPFIGRRTTLLITHRMGMLAMADRIVVMESGRILDVGSHEELIARCPLYTRLYRIHFQEFRESA